MKTLLALLLVLLLAAPVGATAEIGVTLCIEPLFQDDFDGLSFVYNGTERTVATSGCAAVCLSMALSALRPDVEQTPETLFLQAYSMGGYHGGGFSVEQIRAMALKYNVALTPIPGRASSVRDALMEGSPVLVATAKGLLFKKGHYVLLYGVDSADFYYVADPSSAALSAKCYLWDAMFPEEQKGDLFFAFRSVDELENMERRVNLLVQDNLKRGRDAR